MYLSSVTIEGFRASAAGMFSCVFPDRFAVLLGANNVGKTTVCDALYLAHQHRFPGLARPSASLLGDNPRSVKVEFQFGGSGQEGPLGQSLLTRAEGPPRWTRRMERSLGYVRAGAVEDAQHAEATRLIYLPAQRNPVDDLARREAEVLVELLRAEQERRANHRNLTSVRALAGGLLDALVAHDLIQSVESRISDYLGALTGGVARHHAFAGRQEIDDRFLARVLELLLSSVDQRATAQRLEVSGLGYANLLHVAVTLAAIPGGSMVPRASQVPVGPDDVAPDAEAATVDDLPDAQHEADAMEDSFFPELFHATVVIEEPEAHLHPQLQHGLVRYLRRVTAERPELQIILSTHSSEMMAATNPQDIVVMRRLPEGSRIARPLSQLPVGDASRARILRLLSLHFDAARSASLFAERVALVEGVTEALLLRKFGLVWAGANAAKVEFIEALTIVPMGSKVGEWAVQLLCTPGYELCERVAILRDSDLRNGAVPALPAWLGGYDPARVKCYINHPTLEPAITTGNEAVVAAALTAIGVDVPEPVTAGAIDELFALPSGRSRKGQFAFALAMGIDDGAAFAVPGHIQELFEHLFSDAPQANNPQPPNAAAKAD